MRQLKGVLLAMISSSTFGLIPLFAIPALKEGVGLDALLFYRFAISAVVVGIYLLVRRENFRVSLNWGLCSCWVRLTHQRHCS